MNQLSYYVTKRLIVGSKDSSGTIIQTEVINEWEWINEWGGGNECNECNECNEVPDNERKRMFEASEA